MYFMLSLLYCSYVSSAVFIAFTETIYTFLCNIFCFYNFSYVLFYLLNIHSDTTMHGAYMTFLKQIKKTILNFRLDTVCSFIIDYV